MPDTSPEEMKSYQNLLSTGAGGTDNCYRAPYLDMIKTSPLISWKVKNHIDNSATKTGNAASSTHVDQYALLGHMPEKAGEDNPVFLNTKIPWSAFLCGSQGSGKSHTLSCMLEGCLLQDSSIGKNPNPLAGIVFHYDSSQSNGACEAAYLCSKVKKTRVLVSACNKTKMKKQYEEVSKTCGGDIEVETLKFNAADLDAERIKTFMAVGNHGEMPLYMHDVMRVLRQIAIEADASEDDDDSIYQKFRTMVDGKMGSENSGKGKSLTDKQSMPLQMRLDLLDSYIIQHGAAQASMQQGASKKRKKTEESMTTVAEYQNLLRGKPGELIIIDLTDPLTDPDSACVLFDTCLSIFLAQSSCGKVIALDEAHNYMSESNAAARQFADRLLKTIREQRHQGARVVVATQEPTIDTRFLDLCSLTIVHRFTSPAWFGVLKKHIAGLCPGVGTDLVEGNTESQNDQNGVFRKIVQLSVGQSLLFCPTAALTMEDDKIVNMMQRYETFRTRKRITADGGQSRLAGE